VEILPPTPLWVGGLFYLVKIKKEAIMEVHVCVRNLSGLTTQKDLDFLFAQAGDVTDVHIIKDRHTGESKGFAFIRMSAQSEADKAVSMFDSYLLDEHCLTVELVRPREQRGFGRDY
jgi:cold-inducible RNA-binding protein